MKQMLVTLVILGGMAGMANSQAEPGGATFGDDLAFLQEHAGAILLSDSTGQCQVAVVPAFQARVMTSSSRGQRGTSYGWVNRELISSRQRQPHINVYGGEDRFWLGPEGGQFSIFFAGGDPFDLEHWFTPPPIDTEPFDVLEQRNDRLVCGRTMTLTNYSGTQFSLRVRREIQLLKVSEVEQNLGVSLGQGFSVVAFESINSIQNAGKSAWSKPSGLLSIWILGMFNASPSTTVVIPFKQGPETTLGPVVNDSYFGKVPADRLKIGEGVLFFAADANHRSKIGLSPRRATSLLGSYDAVHHVLTLVQFTFPPGATAYVNSMWEIQKEPYGGDVVNSYNDGPSASGGGQLGRFYELETSSPALALEPGQEARHVHRTIHIEGSEKDLDGIARTVLGVGLTQIVNALQ